MHQKVSDLSVDDDKSAPVKKGKLRKAWQYVGGAGNAAKVLLQALFSVTAAVSIWQQVSLSIQETLNLMGWSNKTSGNNNMLEEYISKLQNKSKLAEKPSPDPTTEEPVFAFFRNNFIASCLIFVIVNIALIMFMWRTSKERALERQLRAQQMQDIIVVAGGADKRRKKKETFNWSDVMSDPTFKKNLEQLRKNEEKMFKRLTIKSNHNLVEKVLEILTKYWYLFLAVIIFITVSTIFYAKAGNASYSSPYHPYHPYHLIIMALVIVEDPKEVSELESAAVLKLLGDDFAHSRFPMKVWRLASEPTFGPIKWAEDGKSLIIDEQALEPMLGHFFRSDKFSSFLRQLHLYGFRKMSKPHSFKALPDRNNKPKKKGRSSLDGFAEYAAKDFERDQYESINKVRRFYNNAIREKKTNRSSGSSQSSLSSETSSQATLLSDERRKQMLAEHSYPLTEGQQQQQPPPLSTLPTPTATTGPVPIMNRPLPSPYAEGTSGHYPQLNHHGRFIYPFPHMPLIYSPSTGTYSPPGFCRRLRRRLLPRTGDDAHAPGHHRPTLSQVLHTHWF
ncbi:heat shock transcription factor [Tyrophagus putrescentiae]|nr:heat shock transcription factor [Tyrophagus putrescentiae]